MFLESAGTDCLCLPCSEFKNLAMLLELKRNGKLMIAESGPISHLESGHCTDVAVKQGSRGGKIFPCFMRVPILAAIITALVGSLALL